VVSLFLLPVTLFLLPVIVHMWIHLMQREIVAATIRAIQVASFVS
jgi:hypothetical protein